MQAPKVDLEASAERHHADGCTLEDKKRFDNAGYHFGLSSECAVKHLLQQGGVRGKHADEVMYLHFEELRNAALQVAVGRGLSRLVTLLNNSNYMQYWSVGMRYRETGAVSREQSNKWRVQAQEALSLMVG